MSVLRLTPRGGSTIGPALAAVDAAVLARRDGAAFAEVAVAVVPRVTRALAFAGIATEPSDADLAPPPGLFVAVGTDLSPLPPGLVALDVVRLERLPLGLATREVLRRRCAGILPAGAAGRAQCRALLRAESVRFAWARRAWASRSALRSARARGALRPVVFDRGSVVSAELRGRIDSRDDDLARWLFA